MRFHFCFCFFIWYLCRTYELYVYAIGLKICVITAGIKKHKLIFKKMKKKHNKIVLLEKSKMNSMEI